MRRNPHLGCGEDARHFTARATLQVDFGVNLGDAPFDANHAISGTIDRFVDEGGRQRNRSVEFLPSRSNNRYSAKVREQKTIWTIDGTPAAPGRKWTGTAVDEGTVVQGSFEAVYGTEGRMVGAHLTEKQ